MSLPSDFVQLFLRIYLDLKKLSVNLSCLFGFPSLVWRYLILSLKHIFDIVLEKENIRSVLSIYF